MKFNNSLYGMSHRISVNITAQTYSLINHGYLTDMEMATLLR